MINTIYVHYGTTISSVHGGVDEPSLVLDFSNNFLQFGRIPPADSNNSKNMAETYLQLCPTYTCNLTLHSDPKVTLTVNVQSDKHIQFNKTSANVKT